jgi:hypothetical protein
MSDPNSARKFPLLPAGTGRMAGAASVDLIQGAALQADATYWARVLIGNAYDANGNGLLEGGEGFNMSGAIAAGIVIPGDPPPPVGDLQVLAVGENAVRLSWSRPGALGGLAERYRVEQALAVDGGAVPVAATAAWNASQRVQIGAVASADVVVDPTASQLGDVRSPVTSTTVVFDAGALTVGVAYQFRVRAGNLNGVAEGLFTLPSAAVAAYTAGPPPPPASVQVAYYIGSTGARLSWTDPGPGPQGGSCGARFYRLFLVRPGGIRIDANGTTGYTRNTSADLDLAGGLPDNVTIAACCSSLLPASALTDNPPPAPPAPSVRTYIRAGVLPCAYSAPLLVTPRPQPTGSVLGLDIVYTSQRSVTLSWIPVVGADRYRVLVADSLDGVTWPQPFVVPSGAGNPSRVDRPRATVFFDPIHMVSL